MKTSIEYLGKCKVRLEVVVTSEEFSTYTNLAFEKLAPQISIKGFRPGKAPKLMILEAIGQQRMLSESLNLAISSSFPKALAQLKVNPISSPQLVIKEYPSLSLIEVPGQAQMPKSKLVYQAEFDVLPKVILGDLRKIKIEDKSLKKPKIQVSAQEVEEVLTALQKREAQFEDKSTSCQKGDRVVLDFEGKIDGVLQENLSSKNYPAILGEKILLPAFEEQIYGMKKGEEKTFKIKIPIGSDKNEKEVEFKVQMHQVQKVILPKIDNALASKFGQKNVEFLKKKIFENIKLQKETKTKIALENHVLKQALKMMQVELPESLVLREFERIKQNFLDSLQRQGLTLDKYLNLIKKTAQDLDQTLKAQAAETVKVGLLLGEVVKREKIDPKDTQAAKKAMEKLVSYAR